MNPIINYIFIELIEIEKDFTKRKGSHVYQSFKILLDIINYEKIRLSIYKEAREDTQYILKNYLEVYKIWIENGGMENIDPNILTRQKEIETDIQLLQELYDKIEKNLDAIYHIIKNDLQYKLSLTFSHLSELPNYNAVAIKKLQEAIKLYPKLKDLCVELHHDSQEFNKIISKETIMREKEYLSDLIKDDSFIDKYLLKICFDDYNLNSIETNLYIPINSSKADEILKTNYSYGSNVSFILKIIKPSIQSLLKLHDKPNIDKNKFQIPKALQHLIPEHDYPEEMETITDTGTDTETEMETETHGAIAQEPPSEHLQVLTLEDDHTTTLQKTGTVASLTPYFHTDISRLSNIWTYSMNPLINYIFSEINKISIDCNHINQTTLFNNFTRIHFYYNGIKHIEYKYSSYTWQAKKSDIENNLRLYKEELKLYKETIDQYKSIITEESMDSIKKLTNDIEKNIAEIDIEKNIAEIETVIPNIHDLTIKMTNIIDDIKNSVLSEKLFQEEQKKIHFHTLSNLLNKPEVTILVTSSNLSSKGKLTSYQSIPITQFMQLPISQSVLTPRIPIQRFSKELKRIIRELYPQARNICIELNNNLHKLKYLVNSEHIMQKLMYLRDLINSQLGKYILNSYKGGSINIPNDPFVYKIYYIKNTPVFPYQNNDDISMRKYFTPSSEIAEELLEPLLPFLSNDIQPLLKLQDQPNKSMDTDKYEFTVPEELKHYLTPEDKDPNTSKGVQPPKALQKTGENNTTPSLTSETNYCDLSMLI